MDPQGALDLCGACFSCLVAVKREWKSGSLIDSPDNGLEFRFRAIFLLPLFLKLSWTDSGSGMRLSFDRLTCYFYD